LAVLTTVGMAVPASASSTGISGNLIKNQWVYYTTQRTVTSSGSNIYVQKTDGPQIDVMWYKCSDRGVHGSPVGFPNADPTGRLLIGSNFAANSVFCLAAYSHGNNSTDSWSGNVWWNVFS
jgi:hypothetical protein